MKIYVRAMSLDRSRAMKQAGSYASAIMEHIIKVLVYNDCRAEHVDHWISEIATWIHEADDITIKPGAKKLKPRDIEDSVFNAMGDEVADYTRELKIFKFNNQRGKFNYEDKESYPDFEVTPMLGQMLMDCCLDIMDTTIPMLVSKTSYSVDDYRSVLQRVFGKYI